MTVTEIKSQLDAMGIEYNKKAKKADLEALLDAHTITLEERPANPFAVIEHVQNADRRRTIRNKVLRIASGKEKPTKMTRLLSQIETIAARSGVTINAGQLVQAVQAA